MKRCNSCGRTIKENMAGNGNKELKYCLECLDEKGKLKSYEEVSENLAKYLIRTQGLDEKAAENAAKAIASSQPEWDKKQGVYFEKDMKKKKRLVVVLFTILALIFGITGFSYWYWYSTTYNFNIFENGENHLITRQVGNHTIYELDIPGAQVLPAMVYDETADEDIDMQGGVRVKEPQDIFVFSSENKSQWYYPFWKREWGMFAYNITEGFGERLNNIRLKYPGVLLENKYLIQQAVDEGFNIIFDPDIYAKMSKPTNVRYYKLRILSDHYSLFTKPFFPVHDLKPEVIKEFSCPQYSANHFSWCTEDERIGNRSLYLQNLKTSRSIEVCNSLSARSFPTLTENFIAWDDNRDISSNTYSIYSYDLETNKEYKVYSTDKDVYIGGANDRYLIYITSELDTKEYTIHIFDYLEKVVVSEIGGVKLSLHEENMLKYFPGWAFVYISEDADNTLVAWATSGDNPADFDLYFLRIGIDEKPVILENKNSDYPHYPLKVTRKYILSNSWDDESKENTLWVTDISDVDKKEFKCIKLDTIKYISGGFINPLETLPMSGMGVYEFLGDYVFWGVKHRGGDNICWTKISDIFPENQ